jgi:uncharacterized membrane protein
MYIYATVTVCIIIFDKVKPRQVTQLSRNAKWLLLVAGVSQMLFNLGQFQAINLAPNVGYVNAINAGSIAVVTVFAVILFKDELTKQKAIGIIGVTAGLVLLLI